MPGSVLPRMWILAHSVSSQGSLMTLTLSVTGTAGTLLMRTRVVGADVDAGIYRWVMRRVIFRLNQRRHSYGGAKVDGRVVRQMSGEEVGCEAWSPALIR